VGLTCLAWVVARTALSLSISLINGISISFMANVSHGVIPSISFFPYPPNSFNIAGVNVCAVSKPTFPDSLVAFAPRFPICDSWIVRWVFLKVFLFRIPLGPVLIVFDANIISSIGLVGSV